MLTFTKIKETCLYISDIAKTKAFYEQKLGLKTFSEVENRHIFFRAGESVLLCFISETTAKDDKLPPHFGSGQLHFAFEAPADQYEQWKKKIEAADIPIEHEATWRNNLKSFYFRDPDQHLLEVVMPGIWGD